MAVAPLVAFDSFTRTRTDGVGLSDSKHQWYRWASSTTTAANSDVYTDVNATTGTLTIAVPSGTATTRYHYLKTDMGVASYAASTTGTALLRVKLGSVNDGHTIGVTLRNDPTTGQFIGAGLTRVTNTTYFLNVFWRTPTGTLGQLASPTSITASDATPRWLKVTINADNTVTASVWKQGQAESTASVRTSTTTSFSSMPSAAGYPGFFYTSDGSMAVSTTIDTFLAKSDVSVSQDVPIADTFNRTVLPGLGMTDTGDLWTGAFADDPDAYADAPLGSVADNVATVTSTTNTTEWGFVGTSQTVPTVITGRVRLQQAGGSVLIGVRGTPSITNGLIKSTSGYGLSISSTGAGIAKVSSTGGQIIDRTASILFTPGTITTGPTGTWINYRFYVGGTSDLRARVWASGTSEPDWQMTWSDPDTIKYTSGTLFVAATGGSTAGTTYTFNLDDYLAERVTYLDATIASTTDVTTATARYGVGLASTPTSDTALDAVLGTNVSAVAAAVAPSTGLTGALGTVVPLALQSSLDSQASAVSTLRGFLPLTGSVSSQSALTAVVTTVVPVSAKSVIAAATAVTSGLAQRYAVQTSLSSQTTATVGMSLLKGANNLTATSDAASTLTAKLTNNLKVALAGEGRMGEQFRVSNASGTVVVPFGVTTHYVRATIAASGQRDNPQVGMLGILFAVAFTASTADTQGSVTKATLDTTTASTIAQLSERSVATPATTLTAYVGVVYRVNAALNTAVDGLSAVLASKTRTTVATLIQPASTLTAFARMLCLSKAALTATDNIEPLLASKTVKYFAQATTAVSQTSAARLYNTLLLSETALFAGNQIAPWLGVGVGESDVKVLKGTARADLSALSNTQAQPSFEFYEDALRMLVFEPTKLIRAESINTNFDRLQWVLGTRSSANELAVPVRLRLGRMADGVFSAVTDLDSTVYDDNNRPQGKRLFMGFNAFEEALTDPEDQRWRGRFRQTQLTEQNAAALTLGQNGWVYRWGRGSDTDELGSRFWPRFGVFFSNTIELPNGVSFTEGNRTITDNQSSPDPDDGVPPSNPTVYPLFTKMVATKNNQSLHVKPAMASAKLRGVNKRGQLWIWGPPVPDRTYTWYYVMYLINSQRFFGYFPAEFMKKVTDTTTPPSAAPIFVPTYYTGTTPPPGTTTTTTTTTAAPSQPTEPAYRLAYSPLESPVLLLDVTSWSAAAGVEVTLPEICTGARAVDIALQVHSNRQPDARITVVGKNRLGDPGFVCTPERFERQTYTGTVVLSEIKKLVVTSPTKMKALKLSVIGIWR